MEEQYQAVDSISCKFMLYEADSIWLIHYLNVGDKHSLPGGRVHKDETVKDALRREVKEEIGIEIDKFKLVDQNIILNDPGRDNQDCLELFFVGTSKDKVRENKSEDDELPKLVALSDLDSYNIANRYKEIILEHRSVNV